MSASVTVSHSEVKFKARGWIEFRFFVTRLAVEDSTFIYEMSPLSSAAGRGNLSRCDGTWRSLQQVTNVVVACDAGRPTFEG